MGIRVTFAEEIRHRNRDFPETELKFSSTVDHLLRALMYSKRAIPQAKKERGVLTAFVRMAKPNIIVDNSPTSQTAIHVKKAESREKSLKEMIKWVEDRRPLRDLVSFIYGIHSNRHQRLKYWSTLTLINHSCQSRYSKSCDYFPTPSLCSRGGYVNIDHRRRLRFRSTQKIQKKQGKLHPN